MAKTVETRKNWAAAFPGHDTYGSLIVAWIITHPDIFSSDWRLQQVSILSLASDWRILLKMAKIQWKDRSGLSFSAFKNYVLTREKLSMEIAQRLCQLLEWAEDVAREMLRDDYEYAIQDVWLSSRKIMVADGMTAATRKMAEQDGFETGLDLAIQTIEKARSMSETHAAGSLSLAELAKQTEALYGSPRGRPMHTGLIKIDSATLGGPRKGNLWLISGYAKHGKSRLASQIAYNFADYGRGVMVANMEMSKDELRQIYVVMHSKKVKPGGISLTDVMNEDLNDDDKEVYFESSRQLSEPGGIGDNLQLWVPEEDVSADDVLMRAESIHRNRAIDLLVVDYSELLIPVRKREQYRLELGETIRRFKIGSSTHAGGEGMAVLLLHQTSRLGMQNAMKRGHYMVDDMAETAAAERHSNVIMWTLLPEELYAEHKIKVGIAAQRMGGHELYKGTELYADFDKVVIGNIEY